MTEERNHSERIAALGRWAEACGMSRITIRSDDLIWVADRIALLESIIGEDVDLDGPLSDPQPLEPISEERE